VAKRIAQKADRNEGAPMRGLSAVRSARAMAAAEVESRAAFARWTPVHRMDRMMFVAGSEEFAVSDIEVFEITDSTICASQCDLRLMRSPCNSG
jgi:endonuclease/exonuclease/phosphatase family metal-dependent hydrolase